MVQADTQRFAVEVTDSGAGKQLSGEDRWKWQRQKKI